MTEPEDYCDPGAGVFTPGCTQHLPSGEPTSAKLRRVQGELSDAQVGGLGLVGELARVEQERDEAFAARDRANDDVADVLTERDELKAEVERLVDLGSKAMRERAEAVSLLARIGDALSPTGERPEEALGTLVADVVALVEQRDELAAARERHRVVWGIQRDACVKLRQLLLKAEAELVSARTELERLRSTTPTSKEKTMPATADGGPITPADEIEIKATTVGTRTFRVDRAEYEQALADGEVDDLFDGYVSDMDEQTTYTTPDGRIHDYPSGEVIGDESDGPF